MDRTPNARTTPSILHESLPACRSRSTTDIAPGRKGLRRVDSPGRAHVECTCAGRGSVSSERRGVERETRADRRDQYPFFNATTEPICGIHPSRPCTLANDGPVFRVRSVVNEANDWVRVPEPLAHHHTRDATRMIEIVQSTTCGISC